MEEKYEVYHPEGEGPTPKFYTWVDALRAQAQWNKELPGHKARKIRTNAEESKSRTEN